VYAITLPSFGGPEVLTWAEVDEPTCGPGEVVIDVAASAVNRADIMQRQGHYPPPPGGSEVPGLECSGVISEVGSEVTDWAVGDEVCALLAGGDTPSGSVCLLCKSFRGPTSLTWWLRPPSRR